MTKITAEQWLELVSQEADEIVERAISAESDELEIIEREVEVWLTELKEEAPSPLLERAASYLAKVETALAKLKRKKPMAKNWKGRNRNHRRHHHRRHRNRTRQSRPNLRSKKTRRLRKSRRTP